MKRIIAIAVLPAALLMCGCAGNFSPLGQRALRARTVKSSREANPMTPVSVPVLKRLTGTAAEELPLSLSGFDPATEGRPAPVVVMMDDEGARLGQLLSHLEGAEFDRVYLEHARHIQQAQRAARRLDELTAGPLYIRR